MEMEKLNKTQIVLLTLLVSFVTSIATGIVTVTLMDQAPPGVTNTISKVVERTVEIVVPGETQVTTTVKTVIVKENTLIADAVEKNSDNVVRIFTTNTRPDIENPESLVVEQKFIGLGFIVSDGGLITTDSLLVSDDVVYEIVMPDNTTRTASAVMQDENTGIALMQIAQIKPEGVEGEVQEQGQQEGNNETFNSIEFANLDKLRLGETVVAVSGKENIEVHQGIVSAINTENVEMEEGEDVDIKTETEAKTEKYISSINTSISLRNIDSGSMLINVDGLVVGVNIVRAGVAYTLPANIILSAISSLKEETTENPEDITVE